MAEFRERPLKVVIDLTHLLSGGANGGIKPFIFEYVGWLAEQGHATVKLVFLTRQETHGEVRRLARFGDELICLIPDAGAGEVRTRAHSPAEMEWFDPPADLVARLGADLLYCPFGECTWAHPDVPTLATIVDVLHRDYPFSLTPKLVAHREKVLAETMRKADLIQGISEYTLERISHHYDFPRERMFCSPIAIHQRLAPPTSAGKPPGSGPSYFLYPANAWAHKNHRVLLLAYAIYRSHETSDAWDLVLTGHEDGPMRELMALAATLGLGSHVRFLGHLEEDLFSQLWSGAGALVFPSLHEGFGIPLLEAMSFGVPILSSREGALAEVGGDACLYTNVLKPLELADGLLRISRDAELRATLRQEGRERLKSFSFERDAQRFIKELVACARRPARRTTKVLHADERRRHESRSAGPVRISVVVPSFNQARYLPATLDSLAAQDYADLEVRIHDGGSTDGSQEVLRTHPAHFPWISERDGGQADAINRGLRGASGEILAFLNSDDIYYPGALHRVAAYFSAHPECLILYGDAHHLFADGRVMERYGTEPWSYGRLQEVCFLCQPAVFWRREVIERYGLFDDSLQYALDYEYWLRVGKTTAFTHLPGEFLAGSRLHADTKTLSRTIPAHREILQVVLRHGAPPGAVRGWLQHLAHYEAAAIAGPASPLAEERKLYMAQLVAGVMRNAADFGVRLSSPWLSDLERRLDGAGF